MEEEINYRERFDTLLNIQPNYGIDHVKKPVKFNYIGLEIEIAVIYDRSRYTFIRTLIKQVIKLVGNNGYFTSDGTIIGDYSFEIVMKPMSVPKIVKFYRTLKKIIKFSDGSLAFDKEHNCGLHMNFNQYDVPNIEEAHKRLLLLCNEKPEYFDENVYKRTIYNFTFKDYVEFQKTVANKYIGINYLNKKIVEIRNIKVSLSSSKLEEIMKDLLYCLFEEKLPSHKEKMKVRKLKHVVNAAFAKENNKSLNEGLDEGYILIKFDKTIPKVIEITDEVKSVLDEVTK